MLLESAPEEALAYAHARVGIEPLGEAAHAQVVRLLAQLGRAKEAISSYDDAVEIVSKADTKRREIDNLRPLTTAAANEAIEGEV